MSRPTWTLLLVLPLLYSIRKFFREARRTSVIKYEEERVVILGASSGIGRVIAKQYASRGARVCLVGRREKMIDDALRECRSVRSGVKDGEGDISGILGVMADISSAEDMIRLRTTLERDWGGIDTVVVAAGVSATRPLLEVAGITSQNDEASTDGLKHLIQVTDAAIRGNYIGPLVAAVSLIPLLKRSSKSPSVLLISSLGAVIPAPTRTLYGSTKSASLILYQSLAIEHPSVKFSFVLPSTVQGDFRASAVDRDALSDSEAAGTDAKQEKTNTQGLKVDEVAQRCIQAVDLGEKMVFMPPMMRLGHLLYWIWPSFIERKAMKKYDFESKQ